MTYILNIETATHICSVSLAKNGTTIELKESFEDKTHSELVSVFIEDILNTCNIKPSDLSAIAISMGPGSYTGLRIGTSIAKGLCYGLNIPLIAISSLKAMAYGAQKQLENNALFCPMIDARRMEVYTATYDNALNNITKDHALIVDKDSFGDLLKDQKVIFFGTGSEKCKSTISNPNAIFIDESHVSSKNMSNLAYKKFLERDFVNTAYFEPYYLKEFLAIKSKKTFF